MALRLVRFRPGSMNVRDYYALDVEMHWASIVSGAVLTLGAGIFFLLLGNAIGLNAANIVSPDVGGTLKFFSWLYFAVTFIFSYYVGGFLATRTTRLERPSSGMIHGLASWALATVLLAGFGGIAAFGVRALLAGIAPSSANWLAVCVLFLGAIGSCIGGIQGKYSKYEGIGSGEHAGKRVA